MQHASEQCDCEGWSCKKCKRTKCLGFMQTYKYQGEVRHGSVCCSCRNQKKYEWNKANPKKVKASLKRRSVSTRNKMKANTLKWQKANIDNVKAIARNRRALKKQAKGKFTSGEWEQLKLQYNHTCLCCGEQEPDIKLTVDHVIPLSKGGDNYISNIQPLCHSCNSSKWTKTTDYRIDWKEA